MNTAQSDFKTNSRASNELKAALYSMLAANASKTGLTLLPKKGYTTASDSDDKYRKIDVWYDTKQGKIPFQIRSYGVDFWKNGFPLRDSPLVNKNEMELLADGELDNVYFVFASHEHAPSQWGEFKFVVVKMVKGEFLKRDIKEVVGTRNFGDGNHVTFIGCPRETITLRNWK